MRILKIFFYSILSIVAILLVAALFISKSYKVEKEVLIQKPRTEVFAFLKMLKNQDKFSYWATLDSTMQKTYTGTDGTVGFTSAWKGNSDVGSGEQTIAAIKEGEQIDYKLRFIEPWESSMDAQITTTDAAQGATKVQWSISGKSNYPMNIMNPFMGKMVGSDLQYGLDKLKKLMEQ